MAAGSQHARVERLLFVGPMLATALAGRVPTQGEILAQLLAGRGYQVSVVSQRINRYARLADIAWRTLARSRRDEVQMLQVFSGPGFVAGDVASRAATLRRIPIVMTLHGGNMPQFARRFPRWTRRVLSRATALIAPSEFLAQELRWLDLPIRVIPNVIDTGTYTFRLRQNARPRLLWMRAFHDIYHPEMAVRVLERLVKRFPDVQLTMAGPELGLLAWTRALARERGVIERIHFAGFLDADAKRRAGAEHDIYLNTNRIDNMPVSMLEMAAMGLPVVSTRVGGIPHLLTHGVTGLLVDCSDDQAMTDAVSRVIIEPTLCETLSREGRTMAVRCSWENVAPLWEHLLDEITTR